MSDALSILKKYWNHTEFLSPQAEIIESALSGRDTFALLPTGGGKSVCFQIPGMMMPGICLVISPLVALMKDQVANLQKRDIKAMALTGGIRSDELSDLLDNAQFGGFKFLYLSPERLQSEWIMERLKNLPVNLIAIDEAHCVSQWGHDFRPAYLKISALKECFPKVGFLALTATAVPRVRLDIIAQLKLKDVAVYEKSFARPNLSYNVIAAEDKLFSIEKALRRNPGQAVIYVRNRKSCVQVSSQLLAMGFTSTFYHGGLSLKEKSTNMQLWMEEKVQAIVATNAFGMGIDKANVRNVIHIQLPENLENYYQEAGRAGRDGNPASAIMLVSPSDRVQAETQFIAVLPDRKFLLEAYVKLSNYFQIAYGEGIDERFSFSLHRFCLKYNFPPLRTFNALQFLDRQGVITFSQEYSEKATMQFLIESREVIRYCSLNVDDEQVILAILRAYPGIYEMPVGINIPLIAKKSGSPEPQVTTVLQKLKSRDVASLDLHDNDSIIIYNEIREDERTINRIAKALENQNQLKHDQLRSVLNYVNNADTCKSRLLLEYLGDNNIKECGICSCCRSKNLKVRNSSDVAATIISLLEDSKMTSREIEMQTDIPAADVIFALRLLLENEKILVGDDSRYKLTAYE